MKMFDEKNMQRHIGKDMRYDDKIMALREVENYLHQKVRHLPIELSHDCTADEKTHYKTLNYTTYAGMFIMHPLSYGPSLFQMYDAKADNKKAEGHLDWIKQNINANADGKYVKNKQLLAGSNMSEFEAIAVLCGANKFDKHISIQKLHHASLKHRKKLVIKPHPISREDLTNKFADFRDYVQIANPHASLYDLIKKSKIVYTTHISETALTSLILDKKIVPLDKFHERLVGSFSHINHFCFSEIDPLKVVGSIFASAKSGVLHPEVDMDWKQKINDYLDYTLTLRHQQKDFYLE